MDTWYATKDLMLLIDGMGKTFHCPLKSNCQVDDRWTTVAPSSLTGGWTR